MFVVLPLRAAAKATCLYWLVSLLNFGLFSVDHKVQNLEMTVCHMSLNWMLLNTCLLLT